MTSIKTISLSYKPKCSHANGWNKTVYFKLWVFTLKRRFFLCTDCNDLIDAKVIKR